MRRLPCDENSFRYLYPHYDDRCKWYVAQSGFAAIWLCGGVVGFSAQKCAGIPQDDAVTENQVRKMFKNLRVEIFVKTLQFE